MWSHRLRLLSYNIEHGGAEREELIRGVIQHAEPDLVVLQEAVRPDVVERLAKALRMPWWGAMGGHSVGFMSRVEVKSKTWHEIRFGRRRYLELVLGSGVRIFGVHLQAVHSNITEGRRAYELRTLLGQIQPLKLGFHVVTGDFNTVAPGEKLEIGKLPPRLQALLWITGGSVRWVTIQMMLDAGYADVYRVLHKDNGFTFPTWGPNIRLDYAFVPKGEVKRVKSCRVVKDAPNVAHASDHLPLLTEFV